MIREKLIEKNVGRAEDFRWRGHEISRIEGLSDAVFAFAITLLVVSLARYLSLILPIRFVVCLQLQSAPEQQVTLFHQLPFYPVRIFRTLQLVLLLLPVSLERLILILPFGFVFLVQSLQVRGFPERGMKLVASSIHTA